MDIKNLDKLPEKVQKVLKPFLDDLVKVYGQDIISVFTYGSVTGSDYNPRTSDINVAVVLDDISLANLKRSLKTVKAGMRKKITAPLFLTPTYIKMSLDTFPMEFITMKNSRCVLLGQDVLADIEVKNEDLRRECEYQLKGKLLTIRQAYLEQALNRKGLEVLIKAVFRALIPVFQGILWMKEVKPLPTAKKEVLLQIGQKFDMDMASFLEVLHDKETDGRIGNRSAEDFLQDFLMRLEEISKAVDKM